MPRPVVPIARAPRAPSRARSCAGWTGRISGVFSAIRSVSGQEVMKRSSRAFADELRDVGPELESKPSRLADRLDDATRARLEDLRRGRG